MHLNQLYVVFGRSLDQIQTINIHISDLKNYLLKNVIDNIIELNDKILVLLIKTNIPPQVIKELNATVSISGKEFERYPISFNSKR